MNKFWELVEDNAGGTSAARVGALLTTAVVLGVWAFNVIHKGELADLPPNVAMLVFGLWGAKVAQRVLGEPK